MSNETNPEEIESGDVVVLKSGGPPMTADSVTGKTATCMWFVDGDVRKGNFFVTSVRKKPVEAK